MFWFLIKTKQEAGIKLTKKMHHIPKGDSQVKYCTGLTRKPPVVISIVNFPGNGSMGA